MAGNTLAAGRVLVGVSTDQDDPPGVEQLAVRAEEQAIARIQQTLRRTVPQSDLSEIYGTESEALRLEGTRRKIVGGVEELTGLRLGELHTLIAVADGADHYRVIARMIGQTDAAAAVTVDGLVRKGLLTRHHHPSEPNPKAEPTLVSLTARGGAMIGQSEAIRIRLIDAVAQNLDEDELRHVRLAAETLRLKGEQGRRLIGGAPAAS